MCCLESKISGGDPSVLINVFRVKTFGYDAPGATLRVPEEDPNLGQASCQGNLKLCLEGACPRRGLAPPMGQMFGSCRGLYCLEFNFQKTCGNTSASRTCFPTKSVKI
ncbi:hypothetical protein MTR67_007520, partial [Solanum verrucosum]